MGLLGDLKCKLGWHKVSSGRVRPAGDGAWTSVCRRCGAAMRRDGQDDWQTLE